MARQDPWKEQGSLTLSVHSGDSVLITIPDGDPVLIYLSRVDTENRISINIKAPMDYRIDRLPGGVKIVDRRSRRGGVSGA